MRWGARADLIAEFSIDTTLKVDRVVGAQLKSKRQ